MAQLVGIIEPESADFLATSLLTKFGSLGAVLSASLATISKHTGEETVASLLSLVKATVLESLREDLKRAEFSLSDSNVLSYIVASMQGKAEESLHAVFLDSHHRYLSDELVANGTWAGISVRLRTLLRRALEIDCAQIVLFHNHPSGDCRPSQPDIDFTLNAKTVASALGIEIFDHLVVSGSSVFSMRHAGLIP